MPVPNTINDLSPTANSNYPSGSDSPFPDSAKYFRAHGSFLAQLRDLVAGKLSTSSISSFIQTLLDDADAATARTTLGAVGLTGAETVAGVKTFSSSPVVPTPSGGTDAANKAFVESLVAAVGFPGEIRAMARLIAPAGWLLIDGKTVGNAASGATARANADTAALFAELWAFPAASVPIFDSAGAASTRGASAAADFAANKRIALFTPDGGAFLRMWAPGQTVDAGREAGSTQAQSIQAHSHGGDTTTAILSDGSPRFLSGYQQGPTQSEGGAETRPYNLAMPHYIKL